MVDMQEGKPPDTGQGASHGHQEGQNNEHLPPAPTETSTDSLRTEQHDTGDHHSDSTNDDKPGPQALDSSAKPEKANPWNGNAAEVIAAPLVLTEELARAPKVLKGVWNPLRQKRFISTMLRDWTTLTDECWTKTETAMRDLAFAPVDVMRDDSIREMSADEAQVLLAFLRGELELPHPPNFIKATMKQLHRAMLEDIHEAHFNVILTANLPPSVNLKRTANLPHIELFKAVYTANTDGDIGLGMMQCLQRDVKRLICDGAHTLSFVFYSRRAASHWVKQTIKFQRAVITLHDTTRRPGNDANGRYTEAQLHQMYALHVYGGGKFGLAALSRALPNCADAEVLDVEYPRATKTEIYDNRFHAVTFAQAECPKALQGITKVQLDGTRFTLHYFQTNLRLPCSKCYSPRHRTVKCSVTPARLKVLRKRGSRTVTGSVTNSVRPALSTYMVQDIAEFVALLTVQQEPLEAATKVSFEEQAPKSPPTTAQEETVAAPEDSKSPSESGVPGTAAKKDSDRPPATAPAAARKASRKAAPAATPPATTGSTVEEGRSTKKSKKTSKEKKGKKVKFADFQRAETLGHYGALAEEDSEDDSEDEFEDEESGSQDVDMEAPEDFGFASDKLAQPTPSDETMTEEPSSPPQHEPPSPTEGDDQSPYNAHAAQGPPTMETFTDGNEAPCEQSPKPSAPAFVQTTMENYVEGRPTTTPAKALETRNDRTPTGCSPSEYVPATPDSQEDFTMGQHHVGCDEGDDDLLIQAAHWLSSFHGSEVRVEPNGQCAFQALYATLSNHTASTLANSPSSMKQASAVKRGVYTLMMANVRHDVGLGILDPVTEYHRLHPSHPFHESPAAATAALFAHYAQERTRSPGIKVPASFWAGPHELRAMAQYVREPIIVLDVNSAGDAHLQRYMYKDYRLRNGDDHETGYCEALSDRQARDYLHACWSLHVLPYFLILRHHKRHFYGVSHGEVFVKWRAEGGPRYAASVADSHDWKATVNSLRPEETVPTESVNKLANMDSVNGILIKRITTRERLDVVHARLSLPTLDAAGYDDEVTMEILAQEERHIQEAYGLDGYASGSHGTAAVTEDPFALPTRFARVATGDITEVAYFRILRAPTLDDVSKEHTPQYHLFMAANAEAFMRWVSLYRKIFDIPSARRPSTPRTIMTWLLDHTPVLRHLFAFLPYPEIEAALWTLFRAGG